VKTVSDKVVIKNKAFIGLSIRAKMIDGGRLLIRENLADTDPPPRITPIFNLHCVSKKHPRCF